MLFATDVDLLHWEPALFREAAPAAQLLLAGTGDLAATTFTLAGGSLLDAHIGPDQVITVSGSLAGSYPIVSVDSDTQLTLSVLYEGLSAAEGAPAPTPPGDAVALAYAIRSFWPQRKVVSDLIAHAAGLEAGATILNHAELRRPCVLGTLQMIYSALAAAAATPAPLTARADLYERLYRRALRCVHVQIDTDNDGRPEICRTLGDIKLIRT